MSLTISRERDTARLNEQIRLSIVQGIKQVVGEDHVIKITDGNLTADKLDPHGTRLTIRVSIDIYPRTE